MTIKTFHIASRSKIGGILILAVLASSIGSGFQHGYNTGVLNTPQEIIEGWVESELNTKDGATLFWSTIVSIYCIGGMFGGAITSIVANLVGRKRGLIFNNILVFVAACFFGLAKAVGTVYFLVIGRFIVGVNSGLNAGLAPLYLNEISPTRLRGTFGSMYQLNITISILIAQLLGIDSLLGSKELWPILLALIAIVGVLQVVTLFMCPESPKYYLEKLNNEHEAKRALDQLSGGGDVSDEFDEMKKDIDDARLLPTVTIKEMLKTKKLRTPLIIICVLMVAQQSSGINAVMFYSTEIFKMGKLSSEAAKWSTVGVGFVNVLTTMLSSFLIEKSGRKPLLLFGFAGMAASTILLLICLFFVESYKFASYVSIVMVYLFVIFFALGAGSIPWLLGPELFNTAARPMAVSIAVPVNWTFNFIIGIIFLPLQEAIGPYVFIIFIVCQILSFLFIWFSVPETKNRPIDEITALFE